MMDDIENKMLLEAIGEISDVASMDCLYDHDEHCDDESPRCDACKARKALDRLERMLTPCPRPLQERRLTNPAERIFWEEWQKFNARSHGTNHGFTALEHILNPHLDNGKSSRIFPGVSDPPPPPVSTRDAQVAAAIVQFLGTNGGRCLLELCERRIEQEKAERAEWDGGHFYSIVDEPKSQEAKVAQQLADEFFPASKPRLQQHFKGRLFKALKYLTADEVAVGSEDRC